MSLHSDLVAAFAQFKSIVRNAKISREMRETFDADPGGQLLLEADRGSIQVQASDTDKVEIAVGVSVEAHDQEQAEAILEDLSLRFDKVGDVVQVQAEYQGDAKSVQIELDFRILVPRNFNLDLTTSGGDISVKGLQGRVRG